MRLTTKRRELIAAVRAHAEENYGQGWDIVVECYDDAEIAEVIGRARTVKGAIAKFAPMIDVWGDRRAAAEAEIRAAVGTTEGDDGDHYATGDRYDDAPQCGCGRAFASARARDLHVAAKAQEAGTYDRFTQGHHPDGSHVSWRHDEHSGDAWAFRTWEGKGCRGLIDIVQDGDGEYRTVESYAPAWKGQIIYAGFCDADASVPF